MDMKINTGVTRPLKVLFVGNSAVYVNDIPGTLHRLAAQAGFEVDCDSVVKGGVTLAMHADIDSEFGKNTVDAIEKGYDVVFLQDNGNCIRSDELRAACLEACNTLGKAIRRTGARASIYVRPPYGTEKWGYDPIAQCVEFDKLFGEASQELDLKNAYVNRAFAYAIKYTDLELWGEDHAHTSKIGAYLAACVFFCTIFNVSAKVLDSDGLPDEVAEALRDIADKVSLDGEDLWEKFCMDV